MKIFLALLFVLAISFVATFVAIDFLHSSSLFVRLFGATMIGTSMFHTMLVFLEKITSDHYHPL